MSTEPLHARLGPSNHRWPHCPGSVREEERYPDIPGEAAIDGTGSHLLLELCLTNNVPAINYDQQVIGVNHIDMPMGWMVDLDRIGRVQQGLDYITRRVNELKELYPGCAVAVEAEHKSDPGGAFGRTDWWGTCDITITARNGMTGEVYFMEVADYKDGRMYVSEKDNSQLESYLFGKMRPFICSGPDRVRPFHANKVPNCRMTVIQPKTNPTVRYQCSLRPEDNLSTWGVIDSAVKLDAAAYETDDPDAPLVPGKHCQWCKANPKRGGHCTAQANQSLQVVETMSTELEVVKGVTHPLFEQIQTALADPKSLTVEKLADLADAEAGLMAVFDKVKKEIEVRIDQGDRVPGYAKIPGNSRKVWVGDEAATEKMLKARRLKKNDIFPAKLISPAAALKLDCLTEDQKAKILKDHIAIKAGKMSLQKVSRDYQPKIEKEVKDVDLMFANAPDDSDQVEPEVSFL